MEITHSSVPGGGELHDVKTRAGDRFRILLEPTGERRIFIDDPADPDTVLVAIDFEPDEADIIANILHQRSIPDRIAELERRIERLTAGDNAKGEPT